MSDKRHSGIDPPLPEIARQLDVWQRRQGTHARETELYWAQKLHHQATMALANAQDRFCDCDNTTA